MKLRDADWADLRRLLRLARSGTLDRAQEQKLRFLVSKAIPAASRMTLQEVIHQGLFLFGLHEFQKLVYGDEPAAATA